MGNSFLEVYYCMRKFLVLVIENDKACYYKLQFDPLIKCAELYD